MNAHVCQVKKDPIVYLNPHHITQYNILGPEVPDNHSELGEFFGIERIRKKFEIRQREVAKAAVYIYKCMKKIKGDGCVIAPHRIG